MLDERFNIDLDAVRMFLRNKETARSRSLELELISVIEKQLERLEALYASITQAYERDVAVLGRTGNAAVMIAGLFENYYTCLETAFHKISQHFENHLDPVRWHAE